MEIKTWYLENYENDELGNDLLENVSFEDLFNALDSYEDVYETLFGDEMSGDSLIRERIFSQLAIIMQVDYDYVYNQWLLAS
jgi:hypothetical protein